LYRHAKAASLELVAKALLRKNVKVIIRDSSFTPERIRRFVEETLPKLEAKSKGQDVSASVILDEISQAIRNPTDRMIKAFRALGEDQKWLLVALLEQGHSPRVEDLRSSYTRLTRGSSTARFDQLLEELGEGFIRI
jgi:hypothetical protein